MTTEFIKSRLAESSFSISSSLVSDNSGPQAPPCWSLSAHRRGTSHTQQRGPSSHRRHAQRRVGAGALDDPVECVREHEAELSGVAVNSVDLRPPVELRLKADSKRPMRRRRVNKTRRKRAQRTHVIDYSVQRVDQDKVKGGGGGGGQTDLQEMGQRSEFSRFVALS